MIRPAQRIGRLPQVENKRFDELFGCEPLRSGRREPRSNVELTFAVCGLAVTGRFFVELSSIVNVSRSGCCLRLLTRPQADCALVLRAAPGGACLAEGTAQLLLQIAWLHAEAGGWLIGSCALGKADLLSGLVSGLASGMGGLAFPPRTP